jgi:ankyrin repeat protein
LALLLSACGGDNFSMLMQAARFGDTQGIWKYAAEGMDVNERSKDGKTPLILAAAGGHAAAVEALLDLGADVNLQDNIGATALTTAATAGHADTVRVLLTRGANAGIKDRDGGSALLNAVFFGYRNAVAELLKRPQTIPAEDRNEAILVASGMGHTEIVEDMITVGLDVNAVGLHGRTPLMAAAKFDRLETVRLLLKNGARPGAKNEAGETVLQVAQDNASGEIVELISQAIAAPPEVAPAAEPQASAPPPSEPAAAQSPPLP